MVKFKWLYKVYIPGTVIWTVLILISPSVLPPFMEQFKDSFFYGNRVVYILTFFLSTFFLIAHLTWIFKKFRNRLPNNPAKAGSIFGASFGMIWFFGFLEYYHFFGSNLKNGFFAGIKDWVILTIFGLLIGLFFYKKNNLAKLDNNPKGKFKFNLIGLFIPILFTLGRFIFYSNTKFNVRDVTFYGLFLEFLLGISIYIIYLFYINSSEKESSKTTIKNKLFLMFQFFVLNWIIYNFFPLIRRDIPLSMFGFLIGLDILAVMMGITITHFLSKKIKANLD